MLLTHAFTSHIYYLNHVVCFTSCSCVQLCVFSFFVVYFCSYMICTIMEEIKNIYMLSGLFTIGVHITIHVVI